jgi:hypothetical protein
VLVAAAVGGLATAGVVIALALRPEAPTPSVTATAPHPTTGGGVVTAPPPKPTGHGQFSRAIDKVLRDLPLANAAFNAPTTMHLNEPTVIQLLLSGERPIRELKEKITALGEKQGATLKASDSMEAHLTGAGFTIDPVTPAVQLVSGEGVTEWKWEVEPKEVGKRRLHLTLSAIIDLRGRESTYTVRTFERTLIIRVTLRERLTGFAEDNWQWLWSALLIPIVAWLLQRRRKNAPPPQPDP